MDLFSVYSKSITHWKLILVALAMVLGFMLYPSKEDAVVVEYAPTEAMQKQFKLGEDINRLLLCIDNPQVRFFEGNLEISRDTFFDAIPKIDHVQPTENTIGAELRFSIRHLKTNGQVRGHSYMYNVVCPAD